MLLIRKAPTVRWPSQKNTAPKCASTHSRNQADQFNWALDNIEIKNPWVLRLDADEVILEDLWNEIEVALQENMLNVTGFYLRRRVYFMGRWIRHGGYYPTLLLRLFRKGAARSEDKIMDEHLVLLQGEARTLKHDFKDENHKDLAWWKAKHRDYAAREAQAMFAARHAATEATAIKTSGETMKPDLHGNQPEQKRWLKENVYWRMPIFVRPFLYFFYRYFLRAGFLDGATGAKFHFLQAFWYRMLVDKKYFELLHGAR